MAEGRLRLLEDGISKARLILDGYKASALFNAEEYMKYYDCVYSLCAESLFEYTEKLLERFKTAMEESISLKVLPSLMDKNGGPLLIEFLQKWENYKTMGRCLRGFFMSVDRHYTDKGHHEPLISISVCTFDEMVCKDMNRKFADATICLITQDRNGIPVDWNLLQRVSAFYVEVGTRVKKPYYEMFEEAILADTSNYYSQLASQWFMHYSSTDYALQAEQCLDKEKARASQFLYQSSVDKMLQVVYNQLIGQYADKLAEKQRAENVNSMLLQDLLSKCSNLRIG